MRSHLYCTDDVSVYVCGGVVIIVAEDGGGGVFCVDGVGWGGEQQTVHTLLLLMSRMEMLPTDS